MTITANYKPITMYCGSDAPRQVETQAEEDRLTALGWVKDYLHQAYPTTLYREVEQKDKAGNVIDPLIQSQVVQDADHGLGADWVTYDQLPSEQARIAAAPPIIMKGAARVVDSGQQSTQVIRPAFTENVVTPSALKPVELVQPVVLRSDESLTGLGAPTDRLPTDHVRVAVDPTTGQPFNDGRDATVVNAAPPVIVRPTE